MCKFCKHAATGRVDRLGAEGTEKQDQKFFSELQSGIMSAVVVDATAAFAHEAASEHASVRAASEHAGCVRARARARVCANIRV